MGTKTGLFFPTHIPSATCSAQRAQGTLAPHIYFVILFTVMSNTFFCRQDRVYTSGKLRVYTVAQAANPRNLTIFEYWHFGIQSVNIY